MKQAIFVFIAALINSSAFAQQITIGAGYADFGNRSAEGSAVFDIEYQHKPFHDTTRWDVSWGAAVSSTVEGDAFIGAGLVGVYDFDGPWFAEVSLMPGAYFESNPLTDLGNELEFRSLLGVGYTLPQGNAVSLAITHKSNASIGDTNPGLNTLMMRYHVRF